MHSRGRSQNDLEDVRCSRSHRVWRVDTVVALHTPIAYVAAPGNRHGGGRIVSIVRNCLYLVTSVGLDIEIEGTLIVMESVPARAAIHTRLQSVVSNVVGSIVRGGSEEFCAGMILHIEEIGPTICQRLSRS